MSQVFFDKTTGASEGLWVSGTASGTHLVQSFGAGAISNMTTIGRRAFFVIDDGVHGRELWTLDGTTAGTVMLGDINPGAMGSNPYNLTDIGGRLYFTASPWLGSPQLFTSDGTAAGTMQVVSAGFAVGYINLNGTALFAAQDGNGFELWKSDGTAAGTALVKDINPGPASSFPSHFARVGNWVFFSADNGRYGYQLWKSDGTTAGMTIIADINGAADANPTNLTDVNGKLLFAANGGVHGIELWRLNGAIDGTVMVKDINPFGALSSAPEVLTHVNGTLFFSADDGTHSSELWRSDGTAAGTVMVKDINVVPRVRIFHRPFLCGRSFLFGTDGI